MSDVDHPNIVRYYETYDEQKFIYLVMELCPGGELFHKIEKEDHINELAASEIMFKLMSALQHVHSSGIIHRDIKPENIMFGEDNEVKFIDFGFAVV